MNFQSSAILAAVGSGVLYALCLDVGPLGIAALIAPVPILIYAVAAERARHVFFTAFIARAIGSVGFIYAFASVFPKPVLASIILIFALEYALSIVLTRACVRRLPTWATVFSFPLLTTATEFLLQLKSPHGTYGALGYSLIDAALLIQVASLGGIAAVTFVAALVPMSLTLLIVHTDRRQVLLASVVPLLFAVVFGAWRLAQPYQGEARVALASIDSFVMRAVREPRVAPDVAKAYADLIQGLPAAKLDAVVFPERMFADDAGDVSRGSKPLQQVATALDTTVVAGFHENSADGTHRNTARVFTPTHPLQSYTKRKLIPGLESDLQSGHAPLIINDRGVAICKDLDFAPMMREYGGGVRILFVPAWDFVVDGRFHSRMAVMRGVENGFAIARAAAMGRLTVSDAFGRVVAEVVTSDKNPVMLVAAVGVANVATLYSRVGDVFGWLTVFCASALLVWAFAIVTRLRGAHVGIAAGSRAQAH